MGCGMLYRAVIMLPLVVSIFYCWSFDVVRLLVAALLLHRCSSGGLLSFCAVQKLLGVVILLIIIVNYL